ncbi:Cysteine--Trna Ligase, Cytoplasmic [Manis pentadactyla]|nr:Cysteine--Trna Ligase, Cytoplasmic [Manis pentadactyla]
MAFRPGVALKSHGLCPAHLYRLVVSQPLLQLLCTLGPSHGPQQVRPCAQGQATPPGPRTPIGSVKSPVRKRAQVVYLQNALEILKEESESEKTAFLEMWSSKPGYPAWICVPGVPRAGSPVMANCPAGSREGTAQREDERTERKNRQRAGPPGAA